MMELFLSTYLYVNVNIISVFLYGLKKRTIFAQRCCASVIYNFGSEMCVFKLLYLNNTNLHKIKRIVRKFISF